MGATRASQAAPQQAGERLANLAGTAAERWRARLGHYLPLIERIPALVCRRIGLLVPLAARGAARADLWVGS